MPELDSQTPKTDIPHPLERSIGKPRYRTNGNAFKLVFYPYLGHHKDRQEAPLDFSTGKVS